MLNEKADILWTCAKKRRDCLEKRSRKAQLQDQEPKLGQGSHGWITSDPDPGFQHIMQ